MDVGFLVLCPDRNIGGLKNTLGSIKHNCYDRKIVCAVGNDADAAEMAEMKAMCPTVKGEDTITSLINKGIKTLDTAWVFIVFAGSRVPTYIERKFVLFAKSDQDVLFPVVDFKHDFISGSFNGVLISRTMFEAAGDFPEVTLFKIGVNDFEIAKMLWSLDALKHGCNFKAIVGMRIL